MDQEVLVEQKQTEGHRLVEALDAAQLPPSAAFWNYYTDSDQWRLVVVGNTLRPDSGDPISPYRRIAPVIAMMQPPLNALSMADIKPMADTDPLVQALRLMVQTGPGIKAIRLSNNFVNGIHIADALVYRVQ
jgi:hypothetical protein